MDPTSRVLIVGASLAGTRTAEALRAAGFGGQITIAGDESDRPYDRPPLSKGYLAGDLAEENLRLDGALDSERLRWRLGSPAIALDPASRSVVFADGGTETYDRLVIASGTVPVVPPGLDSSLAGVFLMRTLDDARTLRQRLNSGSRRVAVIGAGFVGAELASTCRALGIAVTLIDAAHLPLARPLGEQPAGHLMRLHEEAGTEFKLGVTVESLTSRQTGHSREVSGLVCSDGTVVDADTVVIAVGVRPATDWLVGSGVDLADGVLCHDDLSSISHPAVLAVGDVARWRHPLFGESLRVEHWTNAAEGAAVVADTIMGGSAQHNAIPTFWSDQLGRKIQGVGVTAGADEVSVDETDGSMFATYRRDGRLMGAVSFGKPRRLLGVRRELAAALPAG